MISFKKIFQSKTLLVIIILLSLRMVIHFLLFKDIEALLEIGYLDICAMILAIIAYAVVPKFGTYFGSVAMTAVLLGLPLALFGLLAEAISSRHLSLLLLFTGLSGIGAGILLSDLKRIFAVIIGLAILGGALYGLIKIQLFSEALLIAAPYWMIYPVTLIIGIDKVKSQEN